MTDIQRIGGSPCAPAHKIGRPQGPPTPPESSGVSRTSARGEDTVDFSSRAQWLSKLADLPDIRHDLVNRVKAEIARGTYDNAERIDGALDKLVEDLA